MTILTIRTDQPEAELGLFDDQQKLGYERWQAHRELSTTIHTKIRDLLQASGKDWYDIKGIIFFIGPGSFTGLRIGAAVANTIAATLEIPITGTNGDDWIEHGQRRLLAGKTMGIVVPMYGRDPHITTQKK